MIGILVILLISGLLLWFVEKENLLVLGPLPVWRRGLEFLLGFVLFLLLSVGMIFLEWRLKNPVYAIQISFDPMAILQTGWYHLKSALTEDLLFRGAVLFILIKRLGAKTGMLISAVAFGVYHWFSFGVLDQGWLTLVVVFLMTGLMGWAWAYAFHRSKSIFIGWGMHVGWNLGTAFLSETGPMGKVLLSSGPTGEISTEIELMMLALKMILPPLFAFLFVRFIKPRP